MRRVAGELRKSQAISTFGIGAMVDLPAMSVVLMGLGYWKRQACPLIQEPRLLRAVRQVLGPEVDEIREGPDQPEDNGGMDPMDAHGIPVAMCGEMAGDPYYSLILLGLGVDEMSMAASSLPIVRRIVRAAMAREGRELLDSAMELSTAEEIERFVRKSMDQRFGGILSEDEAAEDRSGA